MSSIVGYVVPMRDLGSFDLAGYSRGRSSFLLLMWWLVQNLIFKAFWLPNRIRPRILRLFGAEIGKGNQIRRGVRVHFPWRLQIGNNCWIGEEVWFINHERITIGNDVCISQASILCSGSHNYRTKSLAFRHKPISILSGAWLGLRSTVLAGVTVGECSVVSAGEVLRTSVPNLSIIINGEIRSVSEPI